MKKTTKTEFRKMQPDLASVLAKAIADEADQAAADAAKINSANKAPHPDKAEFVAQVDTFFKALTKADPLDVSTLMAPFVALVAKIPFGTEQTSDLTTEQRLTRIECATAAAHMGLLGFGFMSTMDEALVELEETGMPREAALAATQAILGTVINTLLSERKQGGLIS